MNLKHFLSWLTMKRIFKRFMTPNLALTDESVVVYDDLVEGMNQLSYPVIKGIVKK